MIAPAKYRNEIDPEEMRKYVGIKFYLQKCVGPDCLREGDHKEHFWFDERLVADEVTGKGLDVGGKLNEAKLISLPIRWFNFCLAVHTVTKKNPLLNGLKLMQKAIEHAKDNYFDPAGGPNNMANKMGFSSYSKLLKMIEDDETEKELLKKHRGIIAQQFNVPNVILNEPHQA